jgi:hypothetical protein
VDQRLSKFLKSEVYEVSTVPEENLEAVDDGDMVEYCLENNLMMMTYYP